MKKTFRSDQLVRSTTPHHHFRCGTCRDEIVRSSDEARSNVGLAPKCECGEFMCPVNPDWVPS